MNANMALLCKRTALRDMEAVGLLPLGSSLMIPPLVSEVCESFRAVDSCRPEPWDWRRHYEAVLDGRLVDLEDDALDCGMD
jgi:hypothetical protein